MNLTFFVLGCAFWKGAAMQSFGGRPVHFPVTDRCSGYITEVNRVPHAPRFGAWCTERFVDTSGMHLKNTPPELIAPSSFNDFAEVRRLLDTPAAAAILQRCHTDEDTAVLTLDEAVAVAYLYNIVENREEWASYHSKTWGSAASLLDKIAGSSGDHSTVTWGIAGIALGWLLDGSGLKEGNLTRVANLASCHASFLGFAAAAEICRDMIAEKKYSEVKPIAKAYSEKYSDFHDWSNYAVFGVAQFGTEALAGKIRH